MSSEWPLDDDDADLDLALNDDAALQQLLDQPAAAGQQQKQHEGFDDSVGDSWIYPSNLPLRSYQHSIAQAALYRNTLVVLPTGLGKTFIAAVVMYNLHRWYPRGKVIFMAPTRPLVSQQIAACQKIMPFPAADTVELTGKLPRAKRAELWASKRVFFATPQVVQSDILDGDNNGGAPFPYAAIKLLVVDEAHRAKGRYAYTQVTESVFARNPFFRVLALSATPGRTMEDVAAVCRNLYISHLEVRWDNSIDVQPYVHQRSLRTIVVALGEAIKEPRSRLLQIIDPYLRQLVAADVLSGALTNVNRNYLLFEQKRFQERTASGQRHPEHSLVAGNFGILISLYHALELLERHGLRVFVSNFDEDEDGKVKFVMMRDAALRQLVTELREQLGPNPFDVSAQPMTNGQVAPMPMELDFGHPKYEQARQTLLQHFEAQPDSRAIVFCEYRESVMLIRRLLLQHKPLLRPRCFVGQGGSTGSIRALTQKQQLQIMADFRSGTSNVLVATSIGEEGIDVGEVELIVCFDICSSNPTRFVQRIGRTGRQKRGHVVMLVTEGREQQLLKDVLATRDQTNRKLLQSPAIKRALYDHAPRLVPPQYSPKCVQRFIEPQPVEEEQELPKTKPRKAAVATAHPKVKSHDLRKFFRQARTEPPMLDTQERLIFEQEEGVPAPAPYEMSASSQQMLRAECSRRSLGMGMRNFLEDSQPEAATAKTTTTSTPTTTTTTSSNSQQEAQRLRKLNRLLQSSKPLLSEAQRGQDLLTQLLDKQLPMALKLFLVQSNPEFVREICAKMELQQALELPTERLNGRQQRTRRLHELLLDLCAGDSDELQRLLQPRAELTMMDLAAPLDAELEANFETACDRIFAGLDEQGFCADNFELVQQQLEALELRQLEQTMKEQLVEESLQEEWEEAITTLEDCSLAQSQWLDFAPEAVQHRSTPLRNSQPSKANQKRQQLQRLEEAEEEEAAAANSNNDDIGSRIEASDLSSNLSKLNSLLSVTTAATAASTPLAASKLKLAENKSLLDALDEDLSAFDQLIALEESKRKDTAEAEPHCLDALHIDLADFLEPLPEEQQLMAQHTAKELTPSPSGAKENQQSNQLSPLPTAPHRGSPDLFAEESMSPLKPPAPKTLAAKLAAKTGHNKSISKLALCSPQRIARPEQSALAKSPTIFELYLQRTRGRSQLDKKTAQSLLSSTSRLPDDSPIVRRTAKRRIIESESEEEKEVPATELMTLPEDDSSDFEQVPATQLMETPSPPRQRKSREPRQKRLKSNPFIIEEADQSGSDHDEEAEVTMGCYIKDSVIVSSDDEDASHNDTTSHAMYLQALRSPIQRQGAFKIPAPRVYHDESIIYSQHLDRDAEPSQYLPCSFIVDEDISAQDVSECPLERAERILKEQRRQKRRAKRGDLEPPAENAPQPKRRRVQRMQSSSSDDDDVIFVK